MIENNKKLKSFLFFCKDTEFEKLIPKIVKIQPKLEELRFGFSDFSSDECYLQPILSNQLLSLKKFSGWASPWGKEVT